MWSEVCVESITCRLHLVCIGPVKDPLERLEFEWQRAALRILLTPKVDHDLRNLLKESNRKKTPQKPYSELILNNWSRAMREIQNHILYQNAEIEDKALMEKFIQDKLLSRDRNNAQKRAYKACGGKSSISLDDPNRNPNGTIKKRRL